MRIKGDGISGTDHDNEDLHSGRRNQFETRTAFARRTSGVNWDRGSGSIQESVLVEFDKDDATTRAHLPTTVALLARNQVGGSGVRSEGFVAVEANGVSTGVKASGRIGLDARTTDDGVAVFADAISGGVGVRAIGNPAIVADTFRAGTHAWFVTTLFETANTEGPSEANLSDALPALGEPGMIVALQASNDIDKLEGPRNVALWLCVRASSAANGFAGWVKLEVGPEIRGKRTTN